MGAITLTQVDKIVQTALVRAKVSLADGNSLQDTVLFKQVPVGKSSVSFASTGEFTAMSYAEGVDVSQYAQDWSADSIELKPETRTVVPVFIGYSSKNALDPDWQVEQGEKMARAIRQQINSDIWALFDGFSQVAAGGGATTDITEAILLNAYQKLADAGAPAPYFLPVTSHVMEDLMTLYTSNTNFAASELRNQVQISGQAPAIFGITPILVSNLPASIRSAASVKTALYSRHAIGMASLYDIRIDAVESKLKGGFDIIASACYKVGEVNDTYGVEIQIDNNDAA